MVEPSADRHRSLDHGAVSGTATKRPKHDLEDHIDMLRALDEQRRNSATQRDYGIKVLEVWLNSWPKSEPKASSERKSKLTEEELDNALEYSQIINCFFKHSLKTPNDINTLCGNKFDTTTSLLKLETIAEAAVPVWFAANLLQAFAATNSLAYSKKALLCYYYIVRELYTADAPGWCIGGARGRAERPSEESPYITSVCVRAILSLIESQEATARYIGCLRGYLEQTERLKSDTLLPQAWKDQELKRINLSCYITLQQCAKSVVFPLDEPISPENSDEMPPFCDCDHKYDGMRKRLKSAATHVRSAFDEAIKEIEEVWRKKFPDGTHDKQQSREQFGHERALTAIKIGRKNAAQAKKAFDCPRGKTPPALHDVFEKIEERLRNAIRGMREELLPVANYFETVLDRELTTAMISEGDWHPVRLAIAASSLVSLDNRRGHDKKLREAVFHISQGLSDRGVFPVAPPEHHQGDRMATVPLNEAILAYVELIRRTPMTSIDEGLFDLVKKMLLFFDDTRVRHPGSEKEITDLNIGKEIKHEGWRKFDVAKSQFDPISTIDAVNALAAINQMLDEKINQVILEHFSVKRLEKNLTALDMDDLFYPDYGLVASGSLQKTLKEIPEGFKKSDWPEDFGRKESVAVTLQKIRAHVQHVSLETEALCSVALHGPPGTGKTTLVEALAKTCGVPLVEVTPSDIIIGARRPSNDKHERCLRR